MTALHILSVLAVLVLSLGIGVGAYGFWKRFIRVINLAFTLVICGTASLSLSFIESQFKDSGAFVLLSLFLSGLDMLLLLTTIFMLPLTVKQAAEEELFS